MQSGWLRNTPVLRICAWGAALSALAMTAPVSAETKAPDFNGIWGKYTYSYPKPYMKGRNIADGYNNDILKPWVVDALLQDELVTKAGRALATAHSLCYPEG